MAVADAFEVQIAESILADLEAGDSEPWAMEFDADWVFDPNYVASELQTIQVAVIVPDLSDNEPKTITANTFTYEMGVNIQKKVDPSDKTALADLCRLAQQIHDFFRKPNSSQPISGRSTGKRELKNLTGWYVLTAKRPVIFDSEYLRTERSFQTEIRLEVFGQR